jgi:methylmalonyl-CoA mutase, N-terminal domain
VARARRAGLDVERFAPRLSFFFAAHNHLFEEVAKFRAARRLWARLMRERFDASDEACRLRFHTQTGGVTLTAQQPMNNVVRVAVQALAAVLGGTQSLHTNAYDEALSLPSEESARLALRTQQVLATESGIADTVDPLGGSHFVEALTDRLEADALALIRRVDGLGGAAMAIPFFQDEIHRVAYAHQRAIEANELGVVGVNRYRTEEPATAMRRPAYAELEAQQARRLAELRARRDAAAVDRAVERVRAAARSADNLMPALVDAVRAMATLGEISYALRGEWGEFRGASA